MEEQSICYMTDLEFNSAQELLDHLLGKDYEPDGITDTLQPGRIGFVFRGQVDAAWPLFPKAHRMGQPSPLWTYAPQSLSFPSPQNQREQRVSLGDHSFEELMGVRRFLEVADKLGLPTPIDYHHFEAHKEHIRNLWNSADDSYKLPFPDARLLPAFALAQHQGVPTRLLDWTESPLVAAYFAAYEASSIVDEGLRRKTERIAVIRLHTGGLKDQDSIQIVQAPRYANSFLRAREAFLLSFPLLTSTFTIRGGGRLSTMLSSLEGWRA